MAVGPAREPHPQPGVAGTAVAEDRQHGRAPGERPARRHRFDAPAVGVRGAAGDVVAEQHHQGLRGRRPGRGRGRRHGTGDADTSGAADRQHRQSGGDPEADATKPRPGPALGHPVNCEGPNFGCSTGVGTRKLKTSVFGFVPPLKVTWATTRWTPGVIATCTVREPPAPTRTPLSVKVTVLIRVPWTLALTPEALFLPRTRVAVPPALLADGFADLPFGFLALEPAPPLATVEVVVVPPLGVVVEFGVGVVPVVGPGPGRGGRRFGRAARLGQHVVDQGHFAVAGEGAAEDGDAAVHRDRFRARTLPWKAVVLPKVAELPTFQKTLQGEAPLVRMTELADAVVSVVPMTKTNWALGSPWASSVSCPVSCAELL